MNKTNAKKIIKAQFNINIKGSTQLNCHGCNEYSLMYGKDLNKCIYFVNK